MEKAGQQNRFGYADLIRAVAILLVLADHCIGYLCPHMVTDNSKLLLFGGDATLFFMLSGALLMPMRDSTGYFIRRRFVKIGLPCVFWILFYFFLSVRNSGQDAEIIWYGFKSLLFRPSFPEGWFFYSLFGLYFMIPVMSRFVSGATKKELQYYLLLWFASSLLPLAKYFTIAGFDPTDNILATFYNFTGYAVAGYYLSRYPLHREKPAVIFGVAAVCLVFIFFPYIFSWRIETLKYRAAFSELSAPTLCWSVLAWGGLQYVGVRFTALSASRTVRILADLAFGAYLAQHLVIYYIIQPLREAGSISMTAAVVSCFALTLLIAASRNLLYLTFRRKKPGLQPGK